MMAVVKADAYGHGARLVVRTLAGQIQFFGVACVSEARELADLVEPWRLFVLSPLLEEERVECVRGGWSTWIGSYEEALAFSNIAGTLKIQARLHLKIDTGMGRYGLDPMQLETALHGLLLLPNVQWEGIATHLPSADEDQDFTRAQLDHFEQLIARARVLGFAPRWVHACNSAGWIALPFGNLVRTGLALYGIHPMDRAGCVVHPPLTWKTRVTAVRTIPVGHGVSYGRTWIASAPTRVATLAAGYADGYPRHLSNVGANVLIRGRRCLVLGRITMDQMMVDIGDTPVVPGDEVVLIGKQGAAEVTARELARLAGTIPWEIFTNLSHPRVEQIAIE